jgi:predicted metal-dependent peptidase
MNAKDWLASARLMATVKAPYFTTAIFQLIPYPTPGLGTFAVSEKAVMMYDPELVNNREWTVEATAWAIIHEVSHYIRGHHARCRDNNFDPQLANIAEDCEINDDIINAKGKLPVDPCLPSKLKPPMKDGLLFEEYYHSIRQHAQKVRMSGSGDGEGGEGDADGSGQISGTKGPKGPGNGKCGGVAGNPLPEEANLPPGMGRSEVEQKRVAKQTAEAIREEASKSRGTVPAGLARWAEVMLGPPHIPWQTKLARACRSAVAFKAGAVDYSYSKPSRRQAALGYGPGFPILPALRAPIPQVAIGIDTSGSMGTAELEEALRESKGILSAVGAQVDFLACDAEVHVKAKVRHYKQLLGMLKGGGGTDFRPIFAAVERTTPRPSVFVFCTDGYGPAPAQPPAGMKVIWVLIGGTQAPAPWGEAIVVDRRPATST